MKKCAELLKNGNKSLVEIRETDTDKVEKYVVCQDFDNSKAYGSKWNLGHYFDVWDNATAEEQMKSAALFLYDMGEKGISYKRLDTFAKTLIIELRECINDDEEFIDILKGIDITENEAEYFDIKDIIFPKLYKIVNVTLRRTQYATVAVVMPDDEDVWSADEYIENKEYIEDMPDLDADDWEYDDYGIEKEGMTKEEFCKNYTSDEVWNADDIDDI